MAVQTFERFGDCWCPNQRDYGYTISPSRYRARAGWALPPVGKQFPTLALLLQRRYTAISDTATCGANPLARVVLG